MSDTRVNARGGRRLLASSGLDILYSLGEFRRECFSAAAIRATAPTAPWAPTAIDRESFPN